MSATTPPCEVSACINLTQEAGFYAQMSALLAGFAVAALTVILTARHHERRQEDDQTASAFFASILGLSATSLIATEVASSTTNGGRTATGSNLVGVSLSISAISLFYAVALALRRADLPQATNVSRWVSGLAIPVIAFSIVPLGSGQIDVERRAADDPVAQVGDIAYILLATLALILVASLLVKRSSTWEPILRHAPVVTCVATIACALAEGLLMTQSMTFTPPPWVDYVWLFLAFAVFTYLGLAATRSRTVSANSVPA